MTSPIIRTEPFPHPAPPRIVPVLRVGDAERTRTCEVLSSHYSAGRLEPDELEDRLAAAMAARTQADLARLLADLPRLDAPTPQPPAGRPAQPASGVTVVAGMVLAASLFVCLMMIFVAMAIAPAWGFSALVGGTVAAVGGVALGMLWMRRPAPAQPPSTRERMPWAK
ncbi:DUF1707 domain-containing protein [Desertihabitans brevis]|uniref:DUF1707 domain-containing protein n=1 Tax=Desertihabitans brevis TaxID=2268447 RepID=A0A367YR97_9ACTN|nr:DUF1707 domain-containing protein [Desertihabitans brevis]RCK68069.1 DUF1707 domain-containing protein [Desertihabitans brevis]